MHVYGHALLGFFYKRVVIYSCAEGEETRDAVLVTDGDSEMGQVLFQHCLFFLMYITCD